MKFIAQPSWRRITGVSAFLFPLLLLALFFHQLEITHAEAPTWENLGIDGGSVYDATIDPKTGRAFLVTHFIPGIYWSDDNGSHWQVDPDSKVGGAGSIEIGPDGALYAAVATGFQRSTDGGQTWTTLADASKALYAGTIFGSDVDPNNFNHMLIATAGGVDHGGAVYTTLDGGNNWVTATLPISPTADVFDVAVDPTRPGVAFATSNDFWYSNTPSFIYRSSDDGLSFTPIFTAPLGVQFQEVAVNSLGTAYAGSSMGVFRSEDGTHWDFTSAGGKMVRFGLNDPATIYVDFAVSHDNGLTWEPSSINTFVAQSSADANLFFTAGPLGIQRSFDGGLTWEDCVKGIDTIEILAVTADPFDNQILYAATSHGAARSMDAGSTWQFPLGDLTFTIHDLSIDPSQSGVLYLAASDGKVYKSPDYGETFTSTQISNGPSNTIWDLLVDPIHTDHIYAATAEMPTQTGLAYGGLYRSGDSAATWLTTTLEGSPVNAIQAGLLLTDTVLYAGLGDYWLGTVEGGIRRSQDNGNSWQYAGLQNKVVSALAVHPLDGQILYAGLGGGFSNSTDHYLYLTQDMGINWDPLPLETSSGIETLSVDVNDPQTIYAATLGQVYISRDGGQNWSLFYESQRGEQFQAIYTPPQPPASVEFLDPELDENGIQIHWKIPNDPQLTGVNLRYLTTTFPTAHTLGISLTNQAGIPDSTETFTFPDPIPGETYYFTAFSYDQAGHFSSPAYISLTVPAFSSADLKSMEPKNSFVLNAPNRPFTTRIVYLATSKGLFRYTGPDPTGTLYLPFILSP